MELVKTVLGKIHKLLTPQLNLMTVETKKQAVNAPEMKTSSLRKLLKPVCSTKNNKPTLNRGQSEFYDSKR